MIFSKYVFQPEEEKKEEEETKTLFSKINHRGNGDRNNI